MELRHLRCFLAVARELHFSRAAETLHIDQSPLSRTIKELEENIGTKLFVRTTRHTRLTPAGFSLLEQVPRVFSLLEQAREGARAAAAGCDGRLRIAVSDGVVSTPRLSQLIALTRQEEPGLVLHFDEVSLAQQNKGLLEDLYDCGFCQSSEQVHGLRSELAWTESLRVAMPVAHPLFAYEQVRVEDVLQFPLLLGHADTCAGYNRQLESLIRQTSTVAPIIAQRVGSFALMMSLVSAGYALALIGDSQIPSSHETRVLSRALAGGEARLSTYLLRRQRPEVPALSRFIERLGRLEKTAMKVGRSAYGTLRVCPS